MFSEERGRRGAIGLAANPALFESNRMEMEKTGTAAAAAARAMDTFGQNLYKTFLPVWNVIQQVGEAMLNIINQPYKGADTVFEWSNVFASFVALLGNGLTTLTGIVITLVQAVQTLGMAAVDVSDIFGYIMTGQFAKAGEAAARLVTNITKNVTAMGSTIATTLRGVGTVWESIYTGLVTTANTAVTATSRVTQTAFEALKTAVVTSTTAMTDDVAKLYGDMADKAVSSIQKIADAQAALARKAFINKFNTEFFNSNKPTPRSADDDETRARNN